MSRETRYPNSAVVSKKGLQVESVDGVPTADGTGTGAIKKRARFVVVASTDASYIMTLPVPVVGTMIYLMNGATGYELRTSTPASISINAGSGASAESAVSANTLIKCVCVTTTAWLVEKYETDGSPSALEAAA